MSKMKKYLATATFPKGKQYQSGLHNTFHMKEQNGQQAMASQSQNSSNGELKGLSNQQGSSSPSMNSLDEFMIWHQVWEADMKKMQEENNQKLKTYKTIYTAHDLWPISSETFPRVEAKPRRVLNPTVDSNVSPSTSPTEVSQKSSPSTTRWNPCQAILEELSWSKIA